MGENAYIYMRAVVCVLLCSCVCDEKCSSIDFCKHPRPLILCDRVP